MTIAEAITAVLSASHRGDQHFHSFLMVDEAAELRAALVALADAVRDEQNENQDLIDDILTLPKSQKFNLVTVRYVHSLEGIKPRQVEGDEE